MTVGGSNLGENTGSVLSENQQACISGGVAISGNPKVGLPALHFREVSEVRDPAQVRFWARPVVSQADRPTPTSSKMIALVPSLGNSAIISCFGRSSLKRVTLKRKYWDKVCRSKGLRYMLGEIFRCVEHNCNWADMLVSDTAFNRSDSGLNR